MIAFAAAQQRSISFLLLTNAPEKWPTRKVKIRNLKRDLGKRGIPTELVWSTEPNAEGLHIHAVAHGRIPQKPLQEVWGSRADTRPAQRSGARSVVGYILKNGFADLDAHLDLNGGRAEHHTRGFLGADLATVEQALRVARGLDRLTYRAVPVGESMT